MVIPSLSVMRGFASYANAFIQILTLHFQYHVALSKQLYCHGFPTPYAINLPVTRCTTRKLEQLSMTGTGTIQDTDMPLKGKVIPLQARRGPESG